MPASLRPHEQVLAGDLRASGELMDGIAFMVQRNGHYGKQQRVIGESGLA
jgi:hypothetical protein